MSGSPPRGGKMVPCSVCGKDVWRHPSTFGRSTCSMACRDAKKIAKRLNKDDGTAKCSKCGDWKPIAEFVRGVGGRPHSYCKPCNAKWHVPDADRKKAYRPAYTLSPEEKADNKRARNRLQHVKRRGAGAGPKRADIDDLLLAQDGKCVYCREDIVDGYHIDHAHPVSRGGLNATSNLQLTCPKCNLRKGAMTHEEFLVSKRRPVVAW